MTPQRLMVISAVTVVLVIVCCLVWFLAGFVADILEDYPETILQTETIFEPGQFGIDSTINEWYDLGVRMLGEQGWDASPNLTQLSVDLVCSPLPQKPILRRVSMHFADAYFAGIVPSTKFAEMHFEPSIHTVSMEIAYEPLRWYQKHLEVGVIKVGWHEAIRIAQQHGGDSFQDKMQSVCHIDLWLYEYRWRISYSGGGDGLHPSAGPTIWIDARTGKVLSNP
jgi:hypothetical protein